MRINKKSALAMRRLFEKNWLVMDLFDFVEASGVPLRTLEDYLNGRVGEIEDRHIPGMASAFGMTTEEFIIFLSRESLSFT